MSQIVENLISEQNQYDLFYNILLSVKSKNPSVRVEKDDRGKCKLDMSGISIDRTENNKTEISSFSITIERFEVPRLFRANDYRYDLTISPSTRGYSSFNKLFFKSELLSDRCSNIIKQTFEYLSNIEEKRRIEKTNNTVLDIILPRKYIAKPRSVIYQQQLIRHINVIIKLTKY